MYTPLRSALIATVLALAVTGVAGAKSHPNQVGIAAAGEGIVAPDPTGLDGAQALTPAAREFSVPAAIRRRMIALESAGNMPSATADLQMWGAETKGGKRSDPINRFARGIINRTSTIALSLTRSAMRFIGTPYVFGGTSPSGFDCSGYVQHVFAMLGIAVPRTADAQYYAGHRTVGGMVAGDLVFFQTYLPGPSHVGIYLGHNKFIHASGHGVMISSLGNSYWAARYLGAKRVVAFH